MKRFVVVEVNGQFYECERPVGCTQWRVMVYYNASRVIERVWIEDDSPPQWPAMSNPHVTGGDE